MTNIELNKGTNYLLKLAKEDPATWIDRGLLGGAGYGAKNMVDGKPLKGLAQIIGALAVGMPKGALNAEITAGQDISRAISHASQGHGFKALASGAKGVYNGAVGPIQGALFGNGLMSPRQKRQHDNPELNEY